MQLKTISLALLCMVLVSPSISFNLILKEDMARYFLSPVVQLFGIRNSSSSVPQLPSDKNPSFYGYSLNLFTAQDGGVGFKIGSPKMVDQYNPALQDKRVMQDPEGGSIFCSLQAEFFTGGRASCALSSPANPEEGDNLGMVTPIRPDGNALACTTSRALDCGAVRYSPGSCFRSTNFGQSWSTSGETKNLTCPITNIEVLFVLDGSKSVGEANFDTVKNWVKDISQHVGFKDGRVAIGVVQYSHYYTWEDINSQSWIRTHIKIGEYQTYPSFAAAVDKIQLHGYTTYTGQALRKVLSDFDSTANYGQRSTKQVMILLTDGVATDAHLVPENAKKLRDIGVIPYAIGVGSERNINVTELRLVANGDPKSDTRVYMVANFTGLNAIAKELEAEIGGGLVLEGENDHKSTGYEMQFGQLGFSVAYSKSIPLRTRRSTSSYGVNSQLEW